MEYYVDENCEVINNLTGKKLKKFKVNGRYAVKAYWKNYYVHRMLWEQEVGVIPKGMVLLFKDGDYENVTIDNLYLAKKYESHNRTQEDFPFCYSIRMSGWVKYVCKYKGEIIASSTRDDFDNGKDMSNFYSGKALLALERVIPNIVARFGDKYEVHTNSNFESGRNYYKGVLRNRETGKWISFNPKNKSNYVSVDGKKIDLLVAVWNSLNPTNLAKEVKFRCPDNACFFDLVKVK